MGLSATLNIAQSSLATNAALSTILSRNIAGVNDPNYSRKTGDLSTSSSGGVTLTGVKRAANDALFANLLSANSDASSSQALSDGLTQLEQTIGLTNTSSTSTPDTSPATLLGKLTNALQTYAATPSDQGAAQTVVSDAKALASGLNSASTTIQSIRSQADAGIATSVATVNSLLQQFSTVNATITTGTLSGADVTDAQDARNKILQSLSQEIGISTVPTANGGMSIYTDSGATLFQGTPRTVSFTPTLSYADGITGNAVMVDGVTVTGASSVMTLKSGKLAGLVQLRDTTTVAYQNQLDQIAGGLISTFADSGPAGTATTVPGLFTYSGAPTMPTAGQTGLASSISVNAAVDPTQGGTITLLRDGGIGGGGAAAYTWNTGGNASYSGYVNNLISKLDATQTFNPSSGGSATATLSGYASSSVGWLEAQRQTASDAASNRGAVVTQTTSSLSSATGVNLDDQLSQMLDLEHSYQASAELMQTVDHMFTALFGALPVQ